MACHLGQKKWMWAPKVSCMFSFLISTLTNSSRSCWVTVCGQLEPVKELTWLGLLSILPGHCARSMRPGGSCGGTRGGNGACIRAAGSRADSTGTDMDFGEHIDGLISVFSISLNIRQIWQVDYLSHPHFCAWLGTVPKQGSTLLSQYFQ